MIDKAINIMYGYDFFRTVKGLNCVFIDNDPRHAMVRVG